MHTAKRGIRAGLVAATLLLVCGVASAEAKTVNVTTQGDPQGLSGDCQTTDQSCSLRQAIYSAQDGDAIVVPSGSYQNILGGGSEYLITANNLTITGAGPGQTIVSGAQVPGNTSRVFQVAPGKTVTIRNMTITGGHVDGTASMTTQYGGGVLVGAPATPLFTEAFLDNVDLSGNSANIGGGAAVLNESSSSFAYLVIENSVVEFNTTAANGDGGGVAAIGDGRAIVLDSTVARNTAGGAGSGTGGGAVAFESSAGGMTTGTGAEIGLANATVAYNTADGNGNGGNIALGATTKLESMNSIIAGGIVTGGGNANCALFGSPAPTVVSEDYNYEGDHAQCGLTQPHDNSSIPASGLLSSDLLANGAATRTATLALVPGSPALNGGNPAGCATTIAGLSGPPLTADQRGIARPQATACDAGAFEFQTPQFTSSTTTLAGTAQVGDTLTCAAPATTSPDGPATVSYSWSDGDTTIDGQTGAQYTLRATDQGQTVSCVPLVQNAAGSVTGARSNTLGPVVAASGSGGGGSGGGGGGHTPAQVAIGGGAVRINSHGTGTVTASCTASPGDSCIVTGQLFGPGKLPATIARKRKRPRAARQLGTISGVISAGLSGLLTIKLNATGRRLLGRHHRLTVRLVATVSNAVGTKTPLRSHLRVVRKP